MEFNDLQGNLCEPKVRPCIPRPKRPFGPQIRKLAHRVIASRIEVAPKPRYRYALGSEVLPQVEEKIINLDHAACRRKSSYRAIEVLHVRVACASACALAFLFLDHVLEPLTELRDEVLKRTPGRSSIGQQRRWTLQDSIYAQTRRPASPLLWSRRLSCCSNISSSRVKDELRARYSC